MAKYRKKPVVIEAEVYKEGMEDGMMPLADLSLEVQENQNLCVVMSDEACPIPIVPYINTLEGPHVICSGDYIITGVKGERYPCKPDIFEMTYEPVNSPC